MDDSINSILETKGKFSFIFEIGKNGKLEKLLGIADKKGNKLDSNIFNEKIINLARSRVDKFRYSITSGEIIKLPGGYGLTFKKKKVYGISGNSETSKVRVDYSVHPFHLD